MLVGWLLIATWHVQAFTVAGGSMAESLRGPHRIVVCPDCGLSFACGFDGTTVLGKRAVCPNCGDASRLLDQSPITAGDRLLVHKAAFALRSPRRWQCVVIRAGLPGSPLVVKRVVGLPGERITLQGGDVYANGAIQRKDLATQRSMAILVHDDRFTPVQTPALPRRWQTLPASRAAHSAWRDEKDRFVLPSGARHAAAQGPDWLVYRHWSRRPGVPSQVTDSPITDRYGYNQTRPVLDAHAVRDLLLLCRLSTHGQGTWHVLARSGSHCLLATFDMRTATAELRHNGHSVARTVPLSFDGAEAELSVSMFDRQFLLAIGEREVFRYPFDSSPPNDTPLSDDPLPVRDLPNVRLAIGSSGIGLEVAAIQVFRDVYYYYIPAPAAAGSISNPGRTPGRTQYRLKKDEYFVLGDNSPFSDDSRSWGRGRSWEHGRSWERGAAVDSEMLVGRPFLLYFPSRAVDWGWLRIQVPDVARIRYIR